MVYVLLKQLLCLKDYWIAVDGSKTTELVIKKTATVKRWYKHMAVPRAFWFRRPKNKLTTF